MATILTRQQIAVLYGFPADTKEVYAHGARIKHTNPGRTNKRPSFTYDELMKHKSAPAVTVLESEVSEIL